MINEVGAAISGMSCMSRLRAALWRALGGRLSATVPNVPRLSPHQRSRRSGGVWL